MFALAWTASGGPGDDDDDDDDAGEGGGSGGNIDPDDDEGTTGTRTTTRTTRNRCRWRQSRRVSVGWQFRDLRRIGPSASPRLLCCDAAKRGMIRRMRRPSSF